jgi:hypothetical protein
VALLEKKIYIYKGFEFMGGINMKKILLAAIVVLFAASAYAEDCKWTNGQAAFCQWSNPTSCWGIGTDYGTSKDASCCGPEVGNCPSGTTKGKTCTCQQLLDNCTKNGSLFTGVAKTGGNDPGENEECGNHSGTFQAGNDVNRQSLGCCAWDTEGGLCWPIWSGIDRDDGIDGAEKVQTCQSGGNKFWNTACPPDGGAGGCPTGTAIYDGTDNGADNCGYSCKWPESENPDKCERVTPDPRGQYGEPTASCGEAVDVCRSYGKLYNGSTCSGQQVNDNGGGNPNPGGNSSNSNSGNGGSSCSQYDSSCNGSAPIVTLSATFTSNSLIAMQNAVNLQVKSTATLRIYDMKGKIVRAQKIEQGNHVVQLQLPRGLYIIKATSGSWKETIKVTVK